MERRELSSSHTIQYHKPGNNVVFINDSMQRSSSLSHKNTLQKRTELDVEEFLPCQGHDTVDQHNRSQCKLPRSHSATVHRDAAKSGLMVGALDSV
jgi:hypothetical protein